MIASAAALLATGCVGTLDLSKDPVTSPHLALWRVPQPEEMHRGGCVRLSMAVSASGSGGLGLNLLAQGEGERRCEVEILEARLAVGGLSIPEVYRPPVLRVSREDAVWVYLPFLFDNAALWKRGVRSADLTVRLRVDGAEVPALAIGLEQWP